MLDAVIKGKRSQYTKSWEKAVQLIANEYQANVIKNVKNTISSVQMISLVLIAVTLIIELKHLSKQKGANND